jgi:hypothetical protein
MVSCSDLRCKMRQLVNEQRFRASTGWLYGFLRRHNVSKRVCASAISKVRSHRQQTDQGKKRSFFQYVSEVGQKQNIACFWNIDETPLLLDMPMKRTMEVKGRRNVPYWNTGNERKRISVVLCCSEHGQKMSPMLVIKEDRRLEQGTCAKGIPVFKRKNSYMTGELCVKWFESVFLYGLRERQMSLPHQLLILDSFSGHLSSNFKQHTKAENIPIAIIQGAI